VSHGEEDLTLAALQARWPRWTIWRGKHTGSWWAMPPPGILTLVNADDLDTLAGKIADIESWETGE
jgi:poly(3-hydroxyalkanoate) synthetase